MGWPARYGPAAARASDDAPRSAGGSVRSFQLGTLEGGPPLPHQPRRGRPVSCLVRLMWTARAVRGWRGSGGVGPRAGLASPRPAPGGDRPAAQALPPHAGTLFGQVMALTEVVETADARGHRDRRWRRDERAGRVRWRGWTRQALPTLEAGETHPLPPPGRHGLDAGSLRLGCWIGEVRRSGGRKLGASSDAQAGLAL